jgi:hypothetical protein
MQRTPNHTAKHIQKIIYEEICISSEEEEENHLRRDLQQQRGGGGGGESWAMPGKFQALPTQTDRQTDRQTCCLNIINITM